MVSNEKYNQVINENKERKKISKTTTAKQMKLNFFLKKTHKWNIYIVNNKNKAKSKNTKKREQKNIKQIKLFR